MSELLKFIGLKINILSSKNIIEINNPDKKHFCIFLPPGKIKTDAHHTQKVKYEDTVVKRAEADGFHALDIEGRVAVDGRAKGRR